MLSVIHKQFWPTRKWTASSY